MSTTTPATEGRKLPFYMAMVEAIRQEMARDSSVFCLGEDVGQIGGVFQSTVGLHKEFGAERVRDTPISETAILGTALGAAAQGMRPIAELMFVDFVGVCYDQILNNISKTTYYYVKINKRRNSTTKFFSIHIYFLRSCSVF